MSGDGTDPAKGCTNIQSRRECWSDVEVTVRNVYNAWAAD